MWVDNNGTLVLGLEGAHDEYVIVRAEDGQPYAGTADDPEVTVVLQDSSAPQREMTPEEEARWEQLWNSAG